MNPRTSPHGTEAPRHEVIIVDDDPDVLFSLATRFSHAGFTPILANDAHHALQRMAEHPNCRRLLTDYRMPGLAGAEWVEVLRQRCADWSVVIMSATDADPGHFIISPKPLDLENLLQHFRRVKPAACRATQRLRRAG